MQGNLLKGCEGLRQQQGLGHVGWRRRGRRRGRRHGSWGVPSWLVVESQKTKAHFNMLLEHGNDLENQYSFVVSDTKEAFSVSGQYAGAFSNRPYSSVHVRGHRR